MLSADVELQLLEQRTYLNGATLFDAMMHFVPEGALAGALPNVLARAKITCAGAELGMLYYSWVAKG